MKQLNKTQSFAFLLGGLLMVIGAGGFVLMWQQKVMCWVFFVGAILFTIMQSMQVYGGRNYVLRRLKNIQAFANLSFVLSAVLMVDTAYGFFKYLFTSSITYYQYIYNKWVALLLLAAILELYTTHRIDSELKKEKETRGDS